jgi:signal transduction histidine kinase
MPSIRLRLTAAYTAALVGTTAAFALALWVGRGASKYRELQRYTSAEANVVLRLMAQAQQSGEPVVEVRDPIVGPVLSERMAAVLDALPGYVVVLDTALTDTAKRALYLSPAARQLDAGDLETLTQTARRLDTDRLAAVLTVNGEEILVVARGGEGIAPPVDRVVAGASTSAAALSGRELVGTMLAIVPLVVVLSIGSAYVIAGRAFRPVDRIINELEAITDGRSLHRRLAADGAGDELARLSMTLNDMIGRLENSFGALRRFTADASHELKTPLTVLRADVERAMSAGGGSTEQLVALEEALQETTRMSELVNSLLTLARADEGRFDLHREPVSMAPLAADVFETAHILGEDAGLVVTMPVCEDAVVMGDRMRLRQLFLNLVTNAIKYTPRGGTVELSVRRRDGNTVAFAVRDTGIGISAADLPYVFDRFWRADRARTRRVAASVSGEVPRWIDERAGFGLGLAISNYIAQAHGGTLTVQSRLTRGSTFTVVLPCVDEAAAERE